jgi:hypothetical protein
LTFGSGARDLEFFHVGFVVPDMAEAKETYSQAFGFHWCMDNTVAQHVMGPDGEVKTMLEGCVSVEGPPFVELLVDPARDLWDSPKFKLNHLGFWAEDLGGARAQLEHSGLSAVIYDMAHDPPLFTFHRSDSGMWIEVVTASYRPAMLEQVRLAQEKLTEGR